MELIINGDAHWSILKKSKQGGEALRIYFFENPPWNFSFFTLPMEIPDKTKLSRWIFPQIVLRSLGNSKAKNKDPWQSHIIFSWSPLDITLCF